MKKISKFFNNFEEYISVTLYIILILLCFLQVLFRFVFNFSLSWTEELSRFVFIFLVYIAASLAVVRKRHVRVEIIDMLVPKSVLKYIITFTELVWMVFIFVIGYKGIEIVQEAFQVNQTSPALQAPMGFIYMIIPFSFILMSFRVLQQIYLRHKQ